MFFGVLAEVFVRTVIANRVQTVNDRASAVDLEEAAARTNVLRAVPSVCESTRVFPRQFEVCTRLNKRAAYRFTV
jgi:hypothetical protein